MRILSKSKRVAVWLAMLLLAAMAYLWLVGIPGFIAEKWLAGKLGPNYQAECSTLRWGLLRGIIVKDLTITSRDADNGFRFAAEEAVLSISRTKRKGSKVGQAAFQIVNGLVSREPVKELHLPQLSGYLEKKDQVLILQQFEGLIGRDAEAGPVRGNLTVDLEKRTFKGTLESACYPMAFGGFMPSNLASVISSFHLENPPLATIDLSGVLGDPEALAVTGRIFTDKFERNGVHVDLLHANLRFKNGILRLDDMVAVRSEGVFRGSVVQDFSGKKVSLKARSGTDPLATARVIKPSFEKWIAPYMKPNNPVNIDGAIDVSYLTKKKAITIHATVEGPELGYGPVMADYGSAQVDISGGTVNVSQIKGDWCGGELGGTVLSDKHPGTTNRFVALDLQLDDASFLDLVGLFSDTSDPTNYAGRVDGSVSIRGDTKTFYDTLDGTVEIHIRNANLFRTRIGRGLSRYLSKLHPTLGPNSQQELTASLLIKDRVISIEKLEIKGTLNTVSGTGTCTLDGKLNLRVQAKLLHEGLTARAIQLVTLPATKLLEFECTGTVSEPKWRAVNAPQKLLRFFQGESKDMTDTQTE